MSLAFRYLPRFVLVITAAILTQACGAAAESDRDQDRNKATLSKPMTAERLGRIIKRVDKDAVQSGSTWAFDVAGLEAMVVYDTAADRMRIVIPISKVDDLKEGELLRLMQANFDSALDARYAIAQDTLWGTFIHPLSSLSTEEFLVGLGQTANIVTSFGTSYSSGLFIFGGGDSAEIERKKLIEELRKQAI